MTIGCLLVAAGGVGLGVGLGGTGDDETLAYDPVLGRTVPLVYQEALRDVEPSTLPETGDVDLDADISPSQNPAEDAQIEDTTPVPPAIYQIPLDDRSNVPFPSGIIAVTNYYSVSDGHLERDVYAGNAGCAFGQPDSCTVNGNEDFEQIGIIIDTITNLDGLDPPPGPAILLPGTGPLTFTGFEGDTVFFTTASGQSGSYSLTSKQASLS